MKYSTEALFEYTPPPPPAKKKSAKDNLLPTYVNKYVNVMNK